MSLQKRRFSYSLQGKGHGSRTGLKWCSLLGQARGTAIQLFPLTLYNYIEIIIKFSVAWHQQLLNVPSSYKKTDALPLFLLADMFFEFAGNFLKAAGSHVPTTRKKLIKFKRE
jgi:hypothetical protein